MTVNVRFAPSPTGLLHIGNIRAALFNYLFAKRTGGSFLLRMDDTDQERSTKEFAQAIERDMLWLGLKWDRFARQSERTDRYFETLDALKKSGRVYPCFETQAELDLKRKSQLGRGLPPVYDRAALKLSEADRAKLTSEGHNPHWRFMLNNADVSWEDGIQGKKTFPAHAVSDPVMVREDGVPLYTFCSIVDDIDMGITHIIRGEDHVTNTAAQIQIWEAITDKPAPRFAHFPLLVSSTGVEMSKRLGTMSIASIREEMKIEPMAITSLLAKLGTSDPIAPHLTIEELASEFEFGKISRATPKFDIDELTSLNAKILHNTPYAQINDRLSNMIGNNSQNEVFWNAVRANLTKFDDIALWWKIVHEDINPEISDPTFIKEAATALPPEPWDQNTWTIWTNAVKAKTGRKGKDLFMSLRLALTGMDHGPELKYLLPIIGPERTAKRLS